MTRFCAWFSLTVFLFSCVCLPLPCRAEDTDAVKGRVAALAEALAKGNFMAMDSLISDKLEWYTDAGRTYKPSKGKALGEKAYIDSIRSIKDRKTVQFEVAEVKSKGDDLCLVKANACVGRDSGKNVTWKQLQIWRKNGEEWVLYKVKDASAKSGLPTPAVAKTPGKPTPKKGMDLKVTSGKDVGKLTTIGSEINQFTDHATGLSQLSIKARQGKKVKRIHDEQNKKLEDLLNE